MIYFRCNPGSHIKSTNPTFFFLFLFSLMNHPILYYIFFCSVLFIRLRFSHLSVICFVQKFVACKLPVSSSALSNEKLLLLFPCLLVYLKKKILTFMISCGNFNLIFSGVCGLFRPYISFIINIFFL